MSPGATFERVYNELKRMLAEGELPPGRPIEPALIGKQIASSITPIRDALHRLTGERLVEAPNHNGFRVPLPTEAELRELYNWNAQLLALATRHIHPSPQGVETTQIPSHRDVVMATARLFVEIARATGSTEHIRAIQQINDRLALFRHIEAKLLGGICEEYSSVLQSYASGDRRQLYSHLLNYHRRRSRLIPRTLAVSAPQQ